MSQSPRRPAFPARALAALAALLSVVAAVPSCAQTAPAPAPPGAPAAVPADAPAGGVVAPEWLAARLGAPGLVVVDARPGLRPYFTGHVPGAQPVAPESLRSVSNGVPGMLYPPDVIHVVASRLGIRNGSRVVVYGEESDVDATLVASALRIAGVPDVAVLDGGFKRWEREGRPVTKERAAVPAGDAGAFRPDTRSIATIDDVRKASADGTALLIDVRPEEQWAAGHIPGAKDHFWKKDVVAEGAEAGSFRSVPELRAAYEALGVRFDRPVIVYCNSGHQASEAFYTLRYRLGHPDVRLYDGSFLEWSMAKDAPVAKAPAPPAPAAPAAPATPATPAAPAAPPAPR